MVIHCCLCQFYVLTGEMRKPILSYQHALLYHKYIFKINFLFKRSLIDSILLHLTGIENSLSRSTHQIYVTHVTKKISVCTLQPPQQVKADCLNQCLRNYVQGSFLSEYQQVCSASFLLPYNCPILMICILFWTTVIVNWSPFFNLGMAASHV